MYSHKELIFFPRVASLQCCIVFYREAKQLVSLPSTDFGATTEYVSFPKAA